LNDAENSSLNILIYLYWINSSLLLEDSWIKYSSKMFWLLNKIFVAGFRNANMPMDLPYARKILPLKLND